MESVVFITVDCLRSDHVGCYGYERETTPTIDSLASRDGAVKLEGYSNSPGTQWATQTLYTGKWTVQIQGHGNPGNTPTLPRVFKENGYATAGFSINGQFSEFYDYDADFDDFYGLDDFKTDEDILSRAGKYVNDNYVSNFRIRQFLSRMYNHYFLPAKSKVSDDAVGPTDEDLVNRAVEWISERQNESRPFFAWIHLMDAHTPYPHRPEHLEAVGGDPEAKSIFNPNKSGDLDDPEYREDAFRAYDAAIRSADEQIERVLATVSDDTVVTVTADHGEDFGEWIGFHMPSVYSSMSQVPLVIDGGNLNDDISGRVQHVDLTPTLVKAAGIEPPEEWEGEPVHEKDIGEDQPIYFTIETDDYGFGVRVGDWKLVRSSSEDDPLLYRSGYLEQEGEEVGDEYPDKREELDAILQEHLDDVRSRMVGEAKAGWDTEEGRENLPEDLEDNLEELGYL